MKIINSMKKFLTINMYGILRDFKSYIHPQKLECVLSPKPHFWFLDAPEYGNLGDQAIAYAITCFLREKFADYDIIEIQQSKTFQYISWIKKNIKPGDIIILQGGGNFGNLYPPYESIRRRIVQNFSENKIIIFPQSIFYTDDKKGQYELKIAKKIYNKENVTIFARDKNSYATFKENFVNLKIGLCPDIVFYLYGRIFNSKKNGLGLCFRNDSEKTEFCEEQLQFIKKCENDHGNISSIDTICDDNIIFGDKRERLVCEKIREFAENELVLTDRLHGMIFSFITKTPCVYFPSKTGKADYIYNSWLTKSDMISSYKNYKPGLVDENYEFDFSELIAAIMGD